jgi:alcohol dehydrogenase class IV
MQIEKFYNTQEINRFYFPGKIFVGKGVFKETIDLCLNTEGNVALVVDEFIYDLPYIKSELSRLEGRVTGIHKIAGAPIAQDVVAFIDSLRDKPEIILSIGGGSATDFAKAVLAQYIFGTFDGLGLSGEWPKQKTETKPLLISVPTTAGSGAEASRYYVTYDKDDHHKVFGKSWELIADWIMLDPVFLESVPKPILISCAFDVFLHYFESLICRYEKSNSGQMISLFGISKLMENLNSIIYKDDNSSGAFSDLMEMATMAGVAISNVRTGNIHEAAGALLERTNLSHPETLFVFFKKAVEQYAKDISDTEYLLLAHLKIAMPDTNFSSISDVVKWWEDAFDSCGLTNKIMLELNRSEEELSEIHEHVFERVFGDKVWVDKECPTKLGSQEVDDLVRFSLSQFAPRK